MIYQDTAENWNTASNLFSITYTYTLPVGGILIPTNKLELLAPYIGLTILLAVTVVTVVYAKNRKRNRD